MLATVKISEGVPTSLDMETKQTPHPHFLRLVASGTRRADSLAERLRKRRIRLVWTREEILSGSDRSPQKKANGDDLVPF